MTNQDCMVCVPCEKHIIRKTGIKPCEDRKDCSTYITYQDNQQKERKLINELKKSEKDSLSIRSEVRKRL